MKFTTLSVLYSISLICIEHKFLHILFIIDCVDQLFLLITLVHIQVYVFKYISAYK